MPMRGELPPVSARSYARASAASQARLTMSTILSENDIQAVAVFCAIGFLLTINVILRFPDFGAMVARLVVFP